MYVILQVLTYVTPPNAASLTCYGPVAKEEVDDASAIQRGQSPFPSANFNQFLFFLQEIAALDRTHHFCKGFVSVDVHSCAQE